MKRFMILGVALVISVQPVDAKAITVRERFGGYVHIHKLIADRWLGAKICVRVNGDQWSAAALQLRYFKAKGGCVCKVRDFNYHDHAGAGWNTYRAKMRKCT